MNFFFSFFHYIPDKLSSSSSFMILFLLIFAFFETTSGQVHDFEVTTVPSWAPTGRLNQFNGFATPRPSLLPENAQMMYASVWAAWSAWSFCSDSNRIRVRACNTVRGFRCLGPNQETEPCDMSTSPIRGVPQQNILSNDYDIIDPWQEDRIEALKQLYPDESIDEKLSRLPEHEKQRLLSRISSSPPAPNLVSHELLNRPQNDNNGAPGATPEKMFGAHPKAFAVKSVQNAVKLDQDQKSTDEILGTDQFIPFLTRDGDSSTKPAQKNRGEGKLLRKVTTTSTTTTEEPFDPETIFNMDGPRFSGKDFKNDIFGNVDDLIRPPSTKIQTTTTTTQKPTTSVKTTVASTTTKQSTTVASTTPIPTTESSTQKPTPTTTVYIIPTRVTPRLPPAIFVEENVELVTPAIEPFPIPTTTTFSPPIPIIPQEISFFQAEDVLMKQKPKHNKPSKLSLHDGEVSPRPTTVPPKELPEEISLDTLHALDWMLANMTKAAEQGNAMNFGNELRDLTSTTTETSSSNKKIVKKTKKNKKTRLIKLHYGEIEGPKMKLTKFPKFKNKNSNRAKMFGIRTIGHSNEKVELPIYAFSNDNENNEKRKNELVDEINDIQDLMEQLDERIESRSALMEPESLKHEHNSPYV